LFEFVGADLYAPPTPDPAPAPDPGPVVIAEPEVTVLRFELNNPIFTRNGVPRVTTEGVLPYSDPVSGRMMLPLVTVVEALGATYTWDGATNTVTIFKNGGVATLVLNQPLAGGMGTPVSRDGRMFVPVAFISDSLGVERVWSDAERALYLFD
jgi:hypothetical protein